MCDASISCNKSTMTCVSSYLIAQRWTSPILCRLYIFALNPKPMLILPLPNNFLAVVQLDWLWFDWSSIIFLISLNSSAVTSWSFCVKIFLHLILCKSYWVHGYIYMFVNVLELTRETGNSLFSTTCIWHTCTTEMF